MKKIFLLIISVFTIYFSSLAFEFKNEELHYVITYKWGLIHKDSGDATLTLKNNGDFYDIKLTGKTRPWADKLFQVRDTLIGKIAKKGFKPQSYTKIAHEKDKYSKDVIKYSYSGNKVTGNITRLKRNKKGETETSSKVLTATGDVFDMLSIYYHLRNIDYSKMNSGSVYKAMMFSGSKVEELTIKLVGKEKIKLRNKTEEEAYHIKFKFTTQGKKKSSDDIDTWISTDSRHIPLQIVGNLSIGQIRCYYIP